MRWTKVGKVLGDLACIHAGYLVAFLIRFGGRLPAENWQAYLKAAPWLTIIALLLLQAYDLFSGRRRRWAEIFSSLVCVVGLLLLAGLSLSYLLQTYAFPRSTFFLAAAAQLVFLAAWRRLAWAWSLYVQGPLTLLVVGPLEEATERTRQLEAHGSALFRVVGILGEGSYGELPETLERLNPKGIIFCSSIPREKRNRMMAEAMGRGISVFLIPGVDDIFLAFSSAEQLNGIPVFRISSFQEVPVGGWKRLLDIALALLLLVPALPVLLLAALAIKLESPRDPVFYLQERVGQGGKIFRLVKLRTMVPDAEKDTGPVLASTDDPRLTRVGRILRATRLDELPQLWNVLKGDMSFVGPRPERPFFVEKLEKEIPGYGLRHSLPVGITGLAQVEGSYSTPPEDKLRYDLMYGKTASPLVDLRIILRTLSVLMLRDKAS
ncbi:exopolysaccharide biosynthesis polyprenyl glycosylphosphotransferase [Desulfovirgula thermocuniculi]|uniref:exopolysaccharide biosynthesis polyprenyl glycosylphosphotransferase n=1 Tax=Desulfovirgula thermocuniculi TaxID=348842 RepID=UPI00041B8FB0|nr:exopolysaccharide biosynthesis polyprenyl glycosylphosphotransferase [Desulfovirgula thermocuniculi]